MSYSTSHAQWQVDELHPRGAARAEFCVSAPWRVLPFGWNRSPAWFNRFSREVTKIMRVVFGARLVTYCDDILIMCSSRQDTLDTTSRLIEVLQTLGFSVNAAKSSLAPSRSQRFLGFIINSASMTISLPESKVLDYSRRAARLAKETFADQHALDSIIGKLVSASAALRNMNMRLQHLKALQRTMHRTQAPRARLTQEARA